MPKSDVDEILYGDKAQPSPEFQGLRELYPEWEFETDDEGLPVLGVGIIGIFFGLAMGLLIWWSYPLWSSGAY